VAGWALDPQAAIGSGIGAVHVWAQRRDLPGAWPEFLGAAALGGARPDVAQAFGPQFNTAGFDMTTTALVPGQYDLTVYSWNRRTARWEDARTVTVTVRDRRNQTAADYVQIPEEPPVEWENAHESWCWDNEHVYHIKDYLASAMKARMPPGGEAP
jgi:acyl-homoserine lactone acylase PvdQ